MKLLLIHAEYFRYKVKERTKISEKIPEEKKENSFKNVLVTFVAVERGDERNIDKITEVAKDNILEVYNKVKASNIVLYPYAHLSSNLATPSDALAVLKKLEEKLKCFRAPFGWYKEFEIKCYGHPLSELSREIKLDEETPVALKQEEKVKSYWYILQDGNLINPNDFNFEQYPDLKIMYEYERKKMRKVTKEPIHVKLMRQLELVDYEPSSDPGNLRWYPKGVIIKKLLEEHVTNIVTRYGAMIVETPIMYSFEDERLKSYFNRFPARQYILKSGKKEYFLRFAACFGQYLIASDMTISYKNLPLKIYELTHYSFRREQRGEIVGLKRLRSFTMPDMHTFCKDMEEAKREFFEQCKLAMKWLDDVELSYGVILRVVKDFYYENEDFFKKLSMLINKPILVEMWDERFFYFVTKIEFAIVDSLHKSATLSTVQIDVENAKRFNIQYVKKDGQKDYPIILHASISGGIDRNLYALLEQAWMRKDKRKPMLPIWLSPIQVRIIPISKEVEDYSRKILEILDKNNIRVDIDDEEGTLEKKILKAEREWIPYIIVIGKKEKTSNKITVRIRETDEIKETTVDELIHEIKEKCKGKPFVPLNLPKELSKRPKFVG